MVLRGIHFNEITICSQDLPSTTLDTQFVTSPPVGFRRNYSSSAFTYDKLHGTKQTIITPKLPAQKATKPLISGQKSR